MSPSRRKHPAASSTSGASGSSSTSGAGRRRVHRRRPQPRARSLRNASVATSSANTVVNALADERVERRVGHDRVDGLDDERRRVGALDVGGERLPRTREDVLRSRSGEVDLAEQEVLPDVPSGGDTMQVEVRPRVARPHQQRVVRFGHEVERRPQHVRPAIEELLTPIVEVARLPGTRSPRGSPRETTPCRRGRS